MNSINDIACTACFGAYILTTVKAKLKEQVGKAWSASYTLLNNPFHAWFDCDMVGVGRGGGASQNSRDMHCWNQ